MCTCWEMKNSLPHDDLVASDLRASGYAWENHCACLRWLICGVLNGLLVGKCSKMCKLPGCPTTCCQRFSKIKQWLSILKAYLLISHETSSKKLFEHDGLLSRISLCSFLHPSGRWFIAQHCILQQGWWTPPRPCRGPRWTMRNESLHELTPQA